MHRKGAKMWLSLAKCSELARVTLRYSKKGKCMTGNTVKHRVVKVVATVGAVALTAGTAMADFSTSTNAVNELVGNVTHANTALTPVALGLSAVLVLWGIIKGIARKAKG